MNKSFNQRKGHHVIVSKREVELELHRGALENKILLLSTPVSSQALPNAIIIHVSHPDYQVFSQQLISKTLCLVHQWTSLNLATTTSQSPLITNVQHNKVKLICTRHTKSRLCSSKMLEMFANPLLEQSNLKELIDSLCTKPKDRHK